MPSRVFRSTEAISALGAWERTVCCTALGRELKSWDVLSTLLFCEQPARANPAAIRVMIKYFFITSITRARGRFPSGVPPYSMRTSYSSMALQNEVSSRRWMLPRLAVGAAEMFVGVGVVHDCPFFRVIDNRSPDFHGDVREDTGRG